MYGDEAGYGDGAATNQLPDTLSRHLAARSTGADVTLLQLSSTFCAPCRHTRILLNGFAERTQGLHHIEVDLTHHPEWSTPLGVHRTPTTVVLDRGGCELFRFSGVPRRADLAEALRPYLP